MSTVVIADYHLIRIYVFVMKSSVSEVLVRFCALDFSGQDRYTMYKVKHMLTITAEAKAYALDKRRVVILGICYRNGRLLHTIPAGTSRQAWEAT